jgi:hypothetical protein
MVVGRGIGGRLRIRSACARRDEFSGGGGGYARADLAGLDALDVDSVYDCLDRNGADSADIATPTRPMAYALICRCRWHFRRCVLP